MDTFAGKMRRAVIIILTGIAVVILLLLLEFAIRYYHEPLKKEVSFAADGCLIYDLESGQYELVSVEINGENLNYIFRNKENAVQGNILVNGYSLFEQNSMGFGFYVEFMSPSPDQAWLSQVRTDSSNTDLYITRDWSQILCRFKTAPEMNLNSDIPAGTEVLLAVPADTLEKAQKIIDDEETSYQTVTGFEWL